MRADKPSSCDFDLLGNCRGAGVVDYLMITIVIAAVAVPIIQSTFGEQINAALFSNRQKLVAFIAQQPKHTVPNQWFSQEPLGEVGGGGKVPEPKELKQVGEVGGNQQTSEPSGELGDVKAVGGEGQLGTVGGVGGEGRLKQVGNVGGQGNIAGGRSSSAGLSAGDSLDQGFFGKSGGGPGNEGRPPGTDAEGATYGRSSGGGGGSGGEEEVGPDGKKVTKADKRESSERPPLGADQTRRDSIAMQAAEEEQERRKGQFDWWFLIRFLILLLIAFLILLIALSNLKKR